MGRVLGSKGEYRDAILLEDGTFRNYKGRIVGFYEDGKILDKKYKTIGTSAAISLSHLDNGADSTFEAVFGYIGSHRPRMLILYAAFVIVGMLTHYFIGTNMGDSIVFLLIPALIGAALYWHYLKHTSGYCFYYCLVSLFFLGMWSLMNYSQGWDIVAGFFLPRLAAILLLLVLSFAEE